MSIESRRCYGANSLEANVESNRLFSRMETPCLDPDQGSDERHSDEPWRDSESLRKSDSGHSLVNTSSVRVDRFWPDCRLLPCSKATISPSWGTSAKLKGRGGPNRLDS